MQASSSWLLGVKCVLKCQPLEMSVNLEGYKLDTTKLLKLEIC